MLNSQEASKPDLLHFHRLLSSIYRRKFQSNLNF